MSAGLYRTDKMVLEPEVLPPLKSRGCISSVEIDSEREPQEGDIICCHEYGMVVLRLYRPSYTGHIYGVVSMAHVQF